ncbi:MAG: single-stranded-DNA-specific exonuclease RecJ [Clostridia bacterium]|nr:single-stranded-DNA-specific exonuclease RecJ [Clostridia bacterium]
MGFKKWVVSDIDKRLAKELSCECDIDPFVALIAASRGYTDVYELEQFISDEPYFTDFYQMADIIKAAEIINTAIENGKKIAIYGDYDCDGVTATALFINYFKTRNVDCIFYIPDRFSEGYGMNEDAIKYLFEQKVELIITVDNGILSFNEINLAKKLGMSVVVTDHHIPSETLPDADAVINPHRKDCLSDFKEICGAEVAFRLICVLEGKEPEELIGQYADILAVGVIADIMPLTLENRTIVKCAIEKIKNNVNIGISALLSVAGIERDSVNSTKIAFAVCPRINAAGRMGKADRAVSLLTTDNMMTALSIANEIDADNALRQKTEKEIFEQAVLKIENKKLMYDRIIVVSGDDWHHGVIGIVASKITEKYGVPTIVISSNGDVSTGSCRSIEGFNIFEAINSCNDLMIKFGGHSQAAGITLKTEDICEFKNRINEFALALEFVPPVLNLDCKLNPSALSVDLAFALKALEPYGVGNKVPVFGVFGVVLERITPIGNNKHLRLLFSKGNNSFQGLLFGVSPDNFCFQIGDCLDIAVTVEPNLYKGEYTVSVQIKAIRMNGTDDTKLFNDLITVCDFLSGRECDVTNITPTREEVGIVYKKICEMPILIDRIKYLYINSLGIGKTLTILEILSELNLIAFENGVCRMLPTAEKTNLLNSITFKTLSERSGNNA